MQWAVGSRQREGDGFFCRLRAARCPLIYGRIPTPRRAARMELRVAAIWEIAFLTAVMSAVSDVVALAPGAVIAAKVVEGVPPVESVMAARAPAWAPAAVRV